MNIPLYNLILNSILVGIILITQFISYPLFKNVGLDFSVFHKKYVNLMGFVVAPIMILELVIVSILFINDFDNTIIRAIAASVVLIWTSTFLIQVPIHNKLSILKDLEKINLLIKSNIIRTFLWTIKLILSTLIL
jgi:hypothetical protein|tara:strand:- start:761 stop:1165 length:405 start_codon:yes stop_codon:yes gene_type:complete